MPLNERETFTDPTTGCRVTRWTDHTSNHPYFTNPAWFDVGRQFLFITDRNGSSELAALDLETGDQRRITTTPTEQRLEHAYQVAVDGDRDRAVMWRANSLVLIDLMTGDDRVLWRLPERWHGIIPNFTADGASVCFGMTQASPTQGFTQRFESRPTSRVLCCDLTTGQTRTVHERDVWLGHVNTSPADPHLISFCHEGPWTRVEHRVWCCDLRDGRAWRVAEVGDAPACVGHEYWLADGQRIAYHGFNGDADPILGIAHVHTGHRTEWVQPCKTKHSHSLDGRLIVGDGSDAEPWILAWTVTDGDLHGPYRIYHHGGGWSEQRRHVHPRISPDGRSVFFTSDQGGEPRVFSVELPDQIDACPLVDVSSAS